jgi:hypothetical protein
MAQGKTASKTNGNGRTSKSLKKSRARIDDTSSVGADEVTMDRRHAADRRGDEPEASELADPAAPKLERRKKVNRRRQIDPTTCERDYTEQEVEFMNALDDYKRKSGRMFPTCSEVLEVIHSLGYVKLSPADIAAMHDSNLPTASAKPMPENWSGVTPVEASVSEMMFSQAQQSF